MTERREERVGGDEAAAQSGRTSYARGGGLHFISNGMLAENNKTFARSEMNSQKFKLDLEKAEKPEIKLPTSIGSWKKQESSRKKHLLLLYWLRQSL